MDADEEEVSATDSPPASPRPSGPPTTLFRLRADAAALAASDAIEKESALALMRIVTGLEALLLRECTRRDRRIAQCEFLLAQQQQQLLAAHACDDAPVGRRGGSGR